jgi:hypothetical protein
MMYAQPALNRGMNSRRIARCLAIVLLLASPAMADEFSKLSFRDGGFSTPALTTVDQEESLGVRVTPTKQFFQGRFLSEVNNQLKQAGQIVDLVATPAMLMADHPMLDEYTKRAQSQFERATREAVKDYLLEETTLRRVTEFFERRSGRSSAQEGRRTNHVAFGLGIYHSVPQLVMRYRLSNAAIKLRLGVEGTTKVDFWTSSMTHTHVSAAYDASRQKYGLSYNISF